MDTLKNVNSGFTLAEPYVPTLSPLPFLEDTLGVGFRLCPKGELHVNHVNQKPTPRVLEQTWQARVDYTWCYH